MPTRYVRMPILTDGGPKALGTLDELANKVRELNADDPRITPQVEDTQAQVRLKDLKTKIAILNRERIELATNVKDEKTKAKLLDLRVQLRELGEMQADPEVALKHADQTEAKLIRIKLLMDDIHSKTVHVKVDERGGFFRQLRGRLFGGTGGVGGRGGVISGLFSGGPGQALSSAGPQGIAALLSLALALGPGVVGFGLGGLTGAGLLGGGLIGAKVGNKQLTADLANIKAAQAAAKAGTGEKGGVKQAIKQYQKDTKFFTPFLNLTSGFKDIGMDLLKGIRPLMGPLHGIFDMLGKDLKTLMPSITSLFKASLPFLKEFARFMFQAGKALLPAFTQALNEMVKSGALKEMTDGLLILIKNGLVPFIRNLGPGMKASATVFKALMVGLGAALNILGATATYIAKGFALFGHQIMNVGKIIGALLTGNWKALKNALGDFGKTFLQALGNLRHFAATVLDALGLGKVGHAIAHTFDEIRHTVASIWDHLWNHVVNVFMGVWHNIVHAFDNFKHAILKAWNETTGFLSAVWRQFWEATVGKALKHAFDNIMHAVDNIRHFLAVSFDIIRKVIANIWDNIWNNTVGRLIRGYKTIVDKTAGFRHDLAHWFDVIRHAIASIWDAIWNKVHDLAVAGIRKLGNAINRIKAAFAGPVNWVIAHILNPLVGIWDKIVGAIGQKNLQFHIAPVAWGGNIANLAAGGKITQGTGPTSDDVLARVSRGETVVSASHSAQLAPIFSAIGVPGYAKGGIPNPISWLAHIGKDIFNWVGRGAGWITSHAFGPLLHRAIPGASGLAHMLHGMAIELIHDAVRGIRDNLSGWGGPLNVRGFGIAPNGPIQRYARALLRAYGWASQWPAFNALVMSESGWNPLIVNKSSGAYGIPQALPGSKMASAGSDWRTNPFTQLRWMMAYIRSNGNFHDPNSAWAFHLKNNWYGNGFHGWFDRPTLIGVGERGRERVDITPGGGGHGATVINININAGPLAHPADIGREVVAAIKQYEKRSGASWRNGRVSSSGALVRGVA